MLLELYGREATELSIMVLYQDISTCTPSTLWGKDDTLNSESGGREKRIQGTLYIGCVDLNFFPLHFGFYGDQKKIFRYC